MNEVKSAHKVVISAQPETVSTAQSTLRNIYDETEEKHYHDILGAVDSCKSTSALHNTLKLVNNFRERNQTHLYTRRRSFVCLKYNFK